MNFSMPMTSSSSSTSEAHFGSRRISAARSRITVMTPPGSSFNPTLMSSSA